MDPQRPRRIWLHRAFGVYCLTAFAAVTWPLYPAFGNRVRPLVLGLPFSLAWIVAWILLTLVVLVAYDAAAHRD